MPLRVPRLSRKATTIAGCAQCHRPANPHPPADHCRRTFLPPPSSHLAWLIDEPSCRLSLVCHCPQVGLQRLLFHIEFGIQATAAGCCPRWTVLPALDYQRMVNIR